MTELPPHWTVTAVGTCKHCGCQIELRPLLGWTHIEGLYSCGVPEKPDEPESWRRAEPVDPDSAGGDEPPTRGVIIEDTR